MNQDKTFLGTEPIGKLLRQLAIPTVIAQLVNMLYNIVDRIYIGHIPGDGDLALTGVGVCLPLILIVSAFAALVASGGAPRASIYMGKQDHDTAEKILGGCFALQLAVSAVLTAVLLLWSRDLLLAFGASENTIGYAASYMQIYAVGTVFVQLTLGLNAFITAQGFAKIGMRTVLIGAVCNIILDPVFIFVFHMGVRGAAVATVLSQMASCAYVLKFLFSERAPVRITFGEYDWQIMKRVLLIGLSPFLIIAFDNILIIALNTVIQKYGGAEQGDMLLTCMTIVQSFMLMVTMPLGGITSGTQTILGYNYGARRPERIKKAEVHIAVLGLVFTTVMFLIAHTIPQFFVRIFTQNETYVELTVWAIKIYTLGIIPLAAQYTVVDGFTGMGIARVAITLSMFRKIIFLGGAFLIPATMGIKYIFYTEPISDFVSAAVSVTIYFLVIDKIINRRPVFRKQKA